MDETTYPRWQQRYSNEDFDRAEALALQLTDEDRKAGREAPPHGYSSASWWKARRIVRAAQEGSAEE